MLAGILLSLITATVCYKLLTSKSGSMSIGGFYNSSWNR